MPPKRQFVGKFTKKPFVKRSYNHDDSESSPKRFKSSTSAAAESSSKATPDGSRHTDEEGNFYWELGGKARRVTVSDFKGNVYVSVREYYEKDGKYFPGKKGISMNLDQFNQLIRVLPSLEEAIGQKTKTGVARPIYTTSAKHDAPEVNPKLEPESEEVKIESKEQGNKIADEEEEEEGEANPAEEEEEEEKKTPNQGPKKGPKKGKEKVEAKASKKHKSKAVVDTEDEEESEEEEYESEEE
ncbi:hypothetical protein ABW20_dc0107370 [Dactylellina cionopaga]|nr:hypothetical protein ABW20_dc0107370 [Dactylellina cionopaga]